MQQEKLKILYYQHNKVLELFSTNMCIISQTMCTSDHIIFLFPASKCQNGCLFLCQAVETCLINFTAQKYYNSWRCLMFAIALSCSVMQSLGSFLQIHGISWNLFVEPDFIYHCTYIALTVFDIFWLVKFLLNSSVHIYIQSFDHAVPNTS